jgi:hypothetical protein
LGSSAPQLSQRVAEAAFMAPQVGHLTGSAVPMGNAPSTWPTWRASPPLQIAAAHLAALCAGQVARAAVGTMDIWPALSLLDLGLIVDQGRAGCAHLELHILGLGRAATAALLVDAQIAVAATRTGPLQIDIADGFFLVIGALLGRNA